MDKRLEIAIAAARAGGQIALRYFRTVLAVELKDDRSPVTQADRECERCIGEVLRRAFPDYGIMGEEFGERPGAGARWIVDPIDGTQNFIRGIPYFATLIGLEEEGEITTGVVYAPAVDDLLYAQRGAGAFDSGGRLHVSSVRSLPEATVLFGGLGRRWSGWCRHQGASGASATTSATPLSRAGRQRPWSNSTCGRGIWRRSKS
jgi:histidinol-phosphatase